jgi:hypothetical protein
VPPVEKSAETFAEVKVNGTGTDVASTVPVAKIAPVAPVALSVSDAEVDPILVAYALETLYPFGHATTPEANGVPSMSICKPDTE